MRVVHSLGWYFPESTGGTENHVAGLAGGLDQRGVSTAVIAPRAPDGPLSNVHRGIRVERYDGINATADSTSGRSFEQLLNELQPDIYHQHAWTARCGLDHLKAAKALGCRTAVTILVPANICLRGTLMRNGTQVCRGEITADDCATCWSQSSGMPLPLSQLATKVPLGLSAAVERSAALRSSFPLLAARARGTRKLREFDAMVEASDMIVVVAEWLVEVMRDHHVDDRKVALCKMGLDDAFLVGPRPARQAGPYRICYFGRFDPIKGIDTIIAAVQALPQSTPVVLDIYGLANTKKDRGVKDKLVRLAGSDRRIAFKESVGPEQVLGVMQGYDAIAVPSKWLETGPLVVLEAIEAGVHVLGAKLGGIAELVEDGVTGTLLPPFDVAAWTAAVERLARSAGERPDQAAPRRARRMQTVVQETLGIYGRIVPA